MGNYTKCLIIKRTLYYHTRQKFGTAGLPKGGYIQGKGSLIVPTIHHTIKLLFGKEEVK